MAWVVGAQGSVTYGPDIKGPSDRRYPIRLPAVVVAAWFNKRHPNPSLTKYVSIKLARGQ